MKLGKLCGGKWWQGHFACATLMSLKVLKTVAAQKQPVSPA